MLNVERWTLNVVPASNRVQHPTLNVQLSAFNERLFSVSRYNPPSMDLATTPSPSPRVWSVDVLRGLVMFTMVFVNDVAGVDAAPWWMKHYEESGRGKNGMTFVDVVFPAFLFIVGLSIPLAVEARRAQGDSW